MQFTSKINVSKVIAVGLLGSMDGAPLKQLVYRWWELTPAPKMAIKRPLLAQMVQDALSRKCIREAVLYLVSYIFCLRVPSEALPMIRVGSGENHGQQSEICCKDGRVQLKLLERKNKPEGRLIQRDCWCSFQV